VFPKKLRRRHFSVPTAQIEHVFEAGDAPADAALVLMRLQQSLQLTRLKHLFHDVGPADEFAVYVKLRNRGPVGVVFDPLADFVISEHVDAEKFAHTALLQDVRGVGGKAALRELGRAFHVEHNGVAGDLRFDGVLYAHGVTVGDDEYAHILRLQNEKTEHRGSVFHWGKRASRYWRRLPWLAA
jgi:hypothetical protein